MFDNIKNWVKNVFGGNDDQENQVDSSVGAGANNTSLPSFSNINKSPLPQWYQEFSETAKNKEENDLIKAAQEGKISGFEAKRAGLSDNVVKATSDARLQGYDAAGAIVKDDPNTKADESSFLTAKAKQTGVALGDAIGWIGEKRGSVWSKMEKAAGLDEDSWVYKNTFMNSIDQNKKSLLERVNEENADSENRENEIKEAGVSGDDFVASQDSYQKTQIKVSDFYNKNKPLLDQYGAEAKLGVPIVDLAKKYKKQGLDVTTWNALKEELQDGLSKTKAIEYGNIIKSNTNLDSYGLRKEYEKTMNGLFFDENGYKGRSAEDRGTIALGMKFQSSLLDEWTKRADEAIDNGRYNDRQSYFMDNGVFEKIRHYTSKYMENFKNNPDGLAVLKDPNGGDGVDRRGANKFNDNNEKQKELYGFVSKDFFEEDKKNADFGDKGFRGGESDRFRAAGNIVRNILFSASTFGERSGLKWRDNNTVESFVGGDLDASFKNKVTGDDTFWNEAGNMILSNPAEVLYYASTIPLAFGEISAFTNASAARAALTTSSRLNKILSAGASLGRGFASETLVSLPIDLATSENSSEMQTNIWLNAFGGAASMLKIAGKIDLYSKTISNIKDVADREKEFLKITGLTSMPPVDVAGDYEDIKKNISNFYKDVETLNIKKDPAVTWLKDSKDYINSLGYDNIGFLGMIAGSLRGDKNVMNIAEPAVKKIHDTITQGKKEIDILEKSGDIERAKIKGDEVVGIVKTSMANIIDSMQPSTIRKLGYTREAVRITRGGVNALVDEVATTMNIPKPLVLAGTINSLLDTKGAAGDKFLSYIGSALVKSNNVEAYKQLQKNAGAIKDKVNDLKVAGDAIKKDPVGFVMDVRKMDEVSMKETLGKKDKVISDVENNVILPKESKIEENSIQVEDIKKTSPTKTKRTISGILSSNKSQSLEEASSKLFSHIKNINNEISGSEQWISLSDSGLSEKMNYISSFVKGKFDLSNKQSEFISRSVYSLLNGASEEEYLPMLGKMLGDVKAGENTDTIVKKMDNMSSIMGGVVNDVSSIVEEDIADIYSILSPSFKKYATFTGKPVQSFVAEGMQNLFDFIKDNNVIFRKSNLPNAVRGMSTVIENDTGKKMIISLSGNMVERMKNFGSILRKTPEDISKFSEDMSTIFHEIGHISMESLKPSIKDKISTSIEKMVREGGFLESDEFIDVLGKDLYSQRIDVYRDLLANNKHSELASEIFSDKFQRDIYDAVFNFEAYQERFLANMGSIGVISSKKQRGYGATIESMFEPIIKGIKDFFDELFEMVGLTIGKGNIKETLTAVNYSILKGDISVLKKGGKFVESSSDVEKTFFKRDISELEQRVLGYKGDTDEIKTYMELGKYDYINIAKSLATLKGGPVVNGSILTKNGLSFMNELFDIPSLSDAQKVKFDSIISKSIEKNHNNIKKSVAVITNKYFNAGTDELKTVYDNGQLISDWFRGLPIRISESYKKASGGIVYDPSVTLVKYALDSDYTKSKKILSDFYDYHFSSSSMDGINGTVEQFKDVMGSDKSIGETIMDLYESMRNKLLTFDKKVLTESEINDILNPLIYNTNEYIYAIANVQKSQLDRPVADYILGKILKRRSDANGIDIGDLSDLTIGISDKLMFDFLGQGAAVRNHITKQISEGLNSFFKEKNVVLPMNKESFWEFLYKDLGFFTAGGDTQLINFSNEIKDILRNSNLEEGVMSSIENIVSSDKYGSLFYDYDPKIAGEFYDDIVGLLEKNGVKNEELENVLDVLKQYNTSRLEKTKYNAIGDYFIDKIIKSNVYTETVKRLDSGKKTIDDIYNDIEKITNSTQLYYDSQKSIDNVANILGGSIESSQKGVSDSTKKLISVMGVNEEDVVKAADKLGVPVEELLDGNIAKERVYKLLFESASKGEYGFADLMMRDEKMMDIFKKHIYSWGENIKNEKKYIINADGNIDTIIDPEKTKLWKLLTKTNTLSNIANNDEETAKILGRMKMARDNSFVKSPSVEFSNVQYSNARFVNGESYVLASREEMKSLAKAINKQSGLFSLNKNNTIINQIYKDTLGKGYTGKIGDRILNEQEIKFSKFVDGYIKDVSNMRNSIGLGDIRQSNGGVNDVLRKYLEKIGSDDSYPDRLINRLTGLWVFVKNEDVTRFSEKYGDINNFVDDALFGSARDKMERVLGKNLETGGRAIRLTNNLLQKIGSVFTFSLPLAPYKPLQQIVSNVVGAASQTSLGGYNSSLYDDLYKLINKDLGFDVIRTQGKNDEFDGIVSSNLGVFGSLLMNGLPIGDAATRKMVVLGGMNKALLDDYIYGGEEVIKKFLSDVNGLNTWKSEFGVKDTDFFTPDRIYRRIKEYVRKNSVGLSSSKKYAMQAKAEREMYAYSLFHKEKYMPFINKTRAHVSAFFVTDNIPELAGINVINNNKMAFGLMKWAVGKTFENGLNIYSDAKKAFKGKTTAMGKMQGIVDFISSPSVSETLKQMYYGAQIGWGIDKVTDGGFDKHYTAAILAPSTSAMMMLVGDAIYEGLYQEGVVGAEKRGQDLREGIGVGLSKMSKNLFDRINLYHEIALSPLVKSISTSIKTKEDKFGLDFFVQMGKVIWKDLITDTLNRYATTSIQGKLIYTNTDGTTLENMVEYILNMDSSKRRQQKRDISSGYDNYSDVGDGNVKSLSEFQSNLLNAVPILRIFGRDRVDYSFAIDKHDEYVKNSGINVLFDAFASKAKDGKLSTVLDNISKVQILEKKDVKDFLKDPLNNESMLLEKGMIGQNYEPFDYIVSGLQTDKKTGKVIRNIHDILISKEDKQNIYNELNKMIIAYDKNGSSISDLAGDGFKEFQSNIARMGSKASVGYLMKAYNSFISKAIAEKYGLKTFDINAGEEGIDIEKEAGMYAGYNNTSSAEYQKFVMEKRAIQKQLLLDNWQLIAGEKHMLLDMQNDYLSKVKDYPFGDLQSNIGNTNTTFGNMINLHNIENVMVSEGLDRGVFNSYSMIFSKQASAINKLENTPENTEKISKISKGLLSQINSYNDTISLRKENGMGIAIHKIGQSVAISPVIDKIQKADPETAKKIVEGIGKDAFTLYVDRLTDSHPADMVTAFEMLSGDSTRKKGGGSGSGRVPSSPSARSIQEKKLLDKYNNLVMIASKYRDPSIPFLPKFTLSYEQKTGKYTPVKVDVKPVFGELKSEQIRPKGQPAPNLSVGKAPVEQGRVLSGSARPKSIAGAKAYSRKARS